MFASHTFLFRVIQFHSLETKARDMELRAYVASAEDLGLFPELTSSILSLYLIILNVVAKLS